LVKKQQNEGMRKLWGFGMNIYHKPIDRENPFSLAKTSFQPIFLLFPEGKMMMIPLSNFALYCFQRGNKNKIFYWGQMTDGQKYINFMLAGKGFLSQCWIYSQWVALASFLTD